MKVSCFVVTICFGADATLRIEAGSSLEQAQDHDEWLRLFPGDPDQIGVVAEILEKLKEAVLRREKEGIEVTTTGRFILKTPAMVAAAMSREVPSEAKTVRLIDLNKATEAELCGLTAVGPATAQKIIAGRPYKNVDELKQIEGIGEAKLAGIKPLVTV